MIASKIIQICFGYDFGCFEFKDVKIKLLVKSIHLLQSVLLSFSSIATVYYKLNAAALIWVCANKIQYMCYVFSIIFFHTGTTLSQFSNDINYIDLALDSNEARKSVRKRNTVVIILLGTHRVIISTYFSMATGTFEKSVWSGAVSYILNISLDVIIFLNIVMFYSVYFRLYLFTKKVSKINTIHDVVTLRQLYKLIAEVAEKYKRLFDPIVSKSYYF